MQNRTAILKEAEIFGARAVDSSIEGFVLEATGDSEKLDEFIEVMQQLRRDRSHALRPGRGFARSQEVEARAAGKKRIGI